MAPKMALSILLSLLLWVIAPADAFTCMDDNGSPVAHWFIYKMPNGFNYAYMDPSSSGPFTQSSGSLDSSSSALGSTLSPLLASTSSSAYVAYNDELPDGKKSDSNYAHAKGVLAYDPASGSGFWLIHSLPKFPDMTVSTYGWGSASSTYGQSFLCVSLNQQNVGASAQQLLYMNPYLYASNMPSGVTINQMSALINGNIRTGQNVDDISIFNPSGVSSALSTFTHFAKSGSLGINIGENMVSPHYSSGFAWETWRRDPEEPSFCSGSQYQYDSLNVEDVSVAGTQWKYTQDHSKIGISWESSLNIACVGGMNRMTSQEDRGGATACLNYPTLYTALQKSFVTVDTCPNSYFSFAKVHSVMLAATAHSSPLPAAGVAMACALLVAVFVQRRRTAAAALASPAASVDVDPEP